MTSGWAAEPTEAPDDFPGSGSPQTVSAPLLLYHHVRAETPIVRYAVSAQRFAQELDLLLEHHYHTITMQDLVSAVRYGTALPDRPVMLTFDDGNQDVLDMAFPLMQSRGMVGVVYVVGDRIGVEGFLSAAGLQRLRRAGWEIGSHGRTHRALDELTADELLDEVAHSKQVIETALGEPIYSFAYPFGIVTEASLLAVIRAGYTSGAGLGLVNAHRPDGLFYLSRREVRGTFELPSFEALLSPP